MWNLSFISREDLKKHIADTINTYESTLRSINLDKFNSNLVDPIKLLFDKMIYKKTFEEIIEDEISRQRDKTNTNAIGYFHQNIFKYIKNCTIPPKGFDVVFFDGKIKYYIEMKNKHNTMNSSSSQKTFTRMLAKLLHDDTSICCLVEVIAKDSQNIEWICTLDGQKVSNERVRRISIDKFYELVTGDKDAFYKLCNHLPNLIEEIILENKNTVQMKDTVIVELKKKDTDLLKSLYLLAFEKYEGFK